MISPEDEIDLSTDPAWQLETLHLHCAEFTSVQLLRGTQEHKKSS